MTRKFRCLDRSLNHMVQILETQLDSTIQMIEKDTRKRHLVLTQLRRCLRIARRLQQTFPQQDRSLRRCMNQDELPWWAARAIEVEVKRRFLELLKDKFNGAVEFKGKNRKWDTIILNKTQELARFLLTKSDSIDFIEQSPSLQRNDTQDLRKRLFELTQTESKELGMGRSTLHYLRKKARNQHSFMVYERVLTKIEPKATTYRGD